MGETANAWLPRISFAADVPPLEQHLADTKTFLDLIADQSERIRTELSDLRLRAGAAALVLSLRPPVEPTPVVAEAPTPELQRALASNDFALAQRLELQERNILAAYVDITARHRSTRPFPARR